MYVSVWGLVDVTHVIKHVTQTILMFDARIFAGDAVWSLGKLTPRHFWIRCMAIA